MQGQFVKFIAGPKRARRALSQKERHHLPLRIVFMGTPDFAVPCLERITADGHTVCGVFCQPDRPRGRGMAFLPPPVKQAALSKDIPVFQPTKLRDGEAVKILQSLAPDLIVVVAYGRILPLEILELPPLGCVNVHASLLPRWRGAAPVQWSIIRGDAITGVTTMYMSEGLDTGDMILTSRTAIAPDETYGQLLERLSQIGAELLSRTLPLLETGAAPRTAQDDSLATLAPPIQKSMSQLDFTASPEDFCNLVRGLNPNPGASARFAQGVLKVHAAVPAPNFTGPPGVILHPKRLIVGCGQGAVEMLAVQPQGKKPMDGAAWRNGLRNLSDDERFS